jgi:hypothetical protein
LQALAGDLVAVQLQQQPGEAGQGGDLHLRVAIGQHQLEYGLAQGILDGGGQIGEAAAGYLIGGRMGGDGLAFLLAPELFDPQVVPALEAGVREAVSRGSFQFRVSSFQPGSGKQFLHLRGNFVPFFPVSRLVFDLYPGAAGGAGGADAIQHGQRQAIEL